MLAVCAGATSVESATVEQKRAAQKVFEAADELYEGGRYEEAAQAFKASYDLVSSPNSRLMWARALRELKRFDEASAQYEGTIRDAQASGGRYPEAQKAAEAELQALTQSFAYIAIKAPPSNAPTEVRLNGRVVPWTAGEKIVAPASKVQVELRFANGNSQYQELVLQAGETREVEPGLSPLPKPAEAKPLPPRAIVAEPGDTGNPMRTGAYVAGAVGVAGLATFAVFGLLNRSAYSDLESKCSNGTCSQSQMDDVDAGRRYQAIANIGLGVGTIGAAAAVTLYLLSSGSGSHQRATALMIGPGSLNLSGRF
jgi:tetratricopeptide (TPR) repeat protein